MYPYLVEVHAKDDGAPMLINIDNIVGIGGGDAMIIKTVDDGAWHVRESYEELGVLLKKSGVLIHKADPRLEDKPLTMEDLKDMVGEPVWNSNVNRWMLVKFVEDIVRFVDHRGWNVDWSEEELIKFPIYRMKRDL